MHRQTLRDLFPSGLRLRHVLRAVLTLLVVSVGGELGWTQTTEPTYGLPTTLSGRASVSFLASEPHAEESYTLYGHAGLRIQDPVQGFDVTFNYGLFDFSDGFFWRFIQGKTDYIVAPQATEDYLANYLEYGAVHETLLRTDSLQRAKIWTSLLTVIQPERRTYRYDAFRNNCSTRPLELYFASLLPTGSPAGQDTLALIDTDEAVRYTLTPKTWREVINRLEAPSPWLVLGTDLAMGTQLDAPISLRERLFIPTDATALLPHLRYGLRSEAPEQWVNPVTSRETYGISKPVESSTSWLLHPTTIFSLLLLLTLLWTGLRLRGKRLPDLLEGLTFTAAGLGGLLLFFLVFISEHPMITTNWNLLVLHPFYLLLPILSLFGRRTVPTRRLLYGLHSLALVVFPLVAYLAGQQIHPSVYLIALTLLVLQLAQLKVLTPPTRSLSHAPQED